MVCYVLCDGKGLFQSTALGILGGEGRIYIH